MRADPEPIKATLTARRQGAVGSRNTHRPEWPDRLQAQGGMEGVAREKFILLNGSFLDLLRQLVVERPELRRSVGGEVQRRLCRERMPSSSRVNLPLSISRSISWMRVWPRPPGEKSRSISASQARSSSSINHSANARRSGSLSCSMADLIISTFIPRAYTYLPANASEEARPVGTTGPQPSTTFAEEGSSVTQLC